MKKYLLAIVRALSKNLMLAHSVGKNTSNDNPYIGIASTRQCRSDRNEAISVVRKNVAIENILKKEKYCFGYVPEITETEWNDAYAAIKKDLPRFYTSVIRNPDISDQERKVALLSLLGLATKSIAYLMNTTPANVSNVKTRTNNKLFGDNSARTFAVNIETL